MKWRYVASLLPMLFLVLLIKKKEEPKLGPIKKNPGRTLASVPDRRASAINKVFPPETIARFEGRKGRNTLLRGRVPQSVQEDFAKDTKTNVGRGYELLLDIGAIALSDYDPKMGELIQKDSNFAYFKATRGHGYQPVALGISNQLLAPVSSVLHVRNADASLRAALLAEGYEEYYYNKSMKFLSIKSTPDQVIQSYKELEARGIKVQLEVLKPRPGSL